MKLPHHHTEVANLNELSSNHNPILLIISDTSISSSPPTSLRCINWSKYSTLLEQSLLYANLPTDTEAQINIALSFLTNSIQSAIKKSSFTKPTICRKNNILIDIAHKITLKNRLRKQWQQIRYPATKRAINRKIAHNRLMLKTQNQEKWDSFLASITSHDSSAYQLYRRLLNKP